MTRRTFLNFLASAAALPVVGVGKPEPDPLWTGPYPKWKNNILAMVSTPAGPESWFFHEWMHAQTAREMGIPEGVWK